MTNYFDALASTWDHNPEKVARSEATANKIKQINFPSNNSLVDFGSGTGLLGVQLLDTFSQVTLADSSLQMLDIAKEKIATGNIKNITTEHVQMLSDVNSKHSAIATLMALHHIDDVNQFFSQAYDKLLENGMLIVADLYQEDGSFHSHNPSYSGHNGFDIDSLSTIAQNAGFDVVSVEKYYEIKKENSEGKNVAYPLFLFVAQKSCS
ncbi:class I SAM-dependent DNA methyltransferase [Vibrio sp. MA40-2]|uniref:class I SAM-dependent DNA methyltransferase n=1 Tax=Vibrio sp. MA40-2 TaxID=3391828 RepID=UPI0039A73EE2